MYDRLKLKMVQINHSFLTWHNKKNFIQRIIFYILLKTYLINVLWNVSRRVNTDNPHTDKNFLSVSVFEELVFLIGTINCGDTAVLQTRKKSYALMHLLTILDILSNR